MQLIAVGLNHQTAPVSVRERLAFSPQVLPDALNNMLQNNIANEAVILSTCNRTEIYCLSNAESVTSWLADFHQIKQDEIKPFLYTLSNNEAIRHIFRVSCGLDSMVLGEPQILGQVKDAVRFAEEQNSMGSHLNALFQRTFAVAKEVRTTTSVGENSVSMAAAAIKMVEQIFPSISDLNVLFIGAGEMIELVATYFVAKTPRKIAVANRTLERAQELCKNLKGPTEAYLLNDLPNILHEYDVVVSSTASPLPIVGKGMVERALKERRNMPIFFLDLAVPRDIESEVDNLNDAFLYTVDDIASIVETGKEARQVAANEAEILISERVADFMLWQQGLQKVPLIRALRDEGERARRHALEAALKQLAKGMSPEEALEHLSVQLTNKLLHPPTQTLTQASPSNSDLIDTITTIYRLNRN